MMQWGGGRAGRVGSRSAGRGEQAGLPPEPPCASCGSQASYVTSLGPTVPTHLPGYKEGASHEVSVRIKGDALNGSAQ